MRNLPTGKATSFGVVARISFDIQHLRKDGSTMCYASQPIPLRPINPVPLDTRPPPPYYPRELRALDAVRTGISALPKKSTVASYPTALDVYEEMQKQSGSVLTFADRVQLIQSGQERFRSIKRENEEFFAKAHLLQKTIFTPSGELRHVWLPDD
ncbi:MAG: hypothetical protein IH984_06970 [Planctomycetes bacterium]|nr:hypothetical protein [Planctomycetota bacterium]